MKVDVLSWFDDFIRNGHEIYTQEAIEVRNVVASALEDSRRIDWIALQGDEFSAGVIVDAPGDGDYYAHGWRTVSYGTGKTFREAVDAAMQTEALAELEKTAALVAKVQP